MSLLLNIANPISIIVGVLLLAAIIYASRQSEQVWPLILVMIVVAGLLIFHTVTLEGIDADNEIELLSQLYHCIAFDLVLILITFISYLWLDDIIAKQKKLKTYDDSLSWFWNKI